MMGKFIQRLKTFYQQRCNNWGYAPLVALLALVMTLINALRSAYPIGYAGLYTLMFEGVAENGFRLPKVLPYYNPQPIPFAYPPAPFYIAAFITKVFGIASLTYLRFVPVVLAVGCVVVFYFLLYKICKDHRIAVLGGVLFLSMPEIMHYDFSAAGMVRGFALFFLLLFWLFFWKTFYTDNYRTCDWVLSAIFLALTGLSHLSYAMFAGFGVILMLIFSQRKWKEKTLLIVRIGVVTALLMAPWLVHIFTQWGFGILLAPMGSHSNFELSQGLYYLYRIVTLNPLWMMVLFLTVFLDSLLQKRWLWVFWFLLTLFGFGESNRFLLLLLIVMTTEFLVFWLQKIKEETKLKPEQAWIPMLAAAVLVIGLAVPNYVTVFQQQQASLTETFIEMGGWLQEHTAEDAEILFIEGDPALNEWLPYFSHRVPETGHWGTEWLGTYNEESEQQFLVRGIAVNDDYDLLLEGMEYYDWTPEYIVLPVGTDLTEQFLIGNDSVVFENDDYLIVSMAQ